MVEYPTEEFLNSSPPPTAEVGIEDPNPPSLDDVAVKSPPRSQEGQDQTQTLESAPADAIVVDGSEEAAPAFMPASAHEVPIQVLDVLPGESYDTPTKRRKVAKGTKAYCLSCRKKTSMQRPRLVKMKKGQRLAGSCKKCSTKTSLIIGKNHILGGVVSL